MLCTLKSKLPATWSKTRRPTMSSPSKTINAPCARTSKTSTWRLFPPQHTETCKGHGRIETRSIWTSPELNDYLDFPHTQQVFRLYRHRIDLTSNKEESEVVFGITSLTVEKTNPAQLLAFNRGHWGIENKLHYVRDV